MDQVSRVGMDTSKRIFQLHGVNPAEQSIPRGKPSRNACFVGPAVCVEQVLRLHKELA